jgi:4-diphosphocytidyl-2-C-methyl-D-erythritol kinase
MRFVQFSAAKLNLSLRVTKKRVDGYHDIVSLFLRLPSVETLSISRNQARAADEVRAVGVEVEGENVVSRALRLAREAGFEAPFLDVEISKTIPPGSGLGAGSGNAAAVLNWLAGDLALQRVALKTGADVPFLYSRCPLALVSGVGEILEPLEPVRLYATIVFPEWSVGTGNAYAQLDDRYGVEYPLSDSAARTEAYALHERLLAGNRAGLLPNDFAPALIEKFPDYLALFDLFDKSGCVAWGITGSGGAAFALSHEPGPPLIAAWPSWASRVMTLDV